MKRLLLGFSILTVLFCQIPVGLAAESAQVQTAVNQEQVVEPANISLEEIEQGIADIELKMDNRVFFRRNSQEYIRILGGYHDSLIQMKQLETDELTAISKKVTALTALTVEGETEPAEITEKRQEFTKAADEIKTRIAAKDLMLEKIEEVNQEILKIRNQELLNQISRKDKSILNISELWKTIVGFSVFVGDVAQTPAEWYRSLSDSQRVSVWEQFKFLAGVGTVCVLFAGVASWLIRRRWGYRTTVDTPNYSQKVGAAFVTLLARGIMPSAIAGGFWWWLRHHQDLFTDGFGTVLRVGTFYMLYLILFCAIVFVLFTPKRPQWRLIEVDDKKAKSLSFALCCSVILICVFSFLQIVAMRLQCAQETLVSIKIFANIIKAFCIIWVARKSLYNNQSLTEEELARSLSDTDEDSAIQGLSFQSKISVLLTAAALVVFGFSLFGYVLLSEFILNRFILSVIVIGVFYIIFKLVTVLFHQFISLKFWVKQLRITKKQTSKLEFWFSFFLTPILVGLCSFVLLAFWGVSVDILLQNIKKFLVGFDIGGMHVSIVSLIMGFVSFCVVLFLTHLIKNSLMTGKLSKIEMDAGIRNSIVAGLGFVGVVIACLVGISVMGGSLQGLALVAGALSLGAGLGLQNIVNNFVSGFILLFERPIKIGDWVVINEQEGIVKQVNIRSTVLETWNKADIIIPNATILSNNLTNLTYRNKQARVDILIGVGYESDVGQVESVLIDIAKNTKGVLSVPAPSVAFLDFADSSLNFRLSFYTSDVFTRASLSTTVRRSIIDRFREEHINIPFPQRVVYLHTEENPVEVKVETSVHPVSKK